ncbi:MAG: DUF2852 domain-containing protein [Epibacterium sp.]|nr:DUF2852 domain-containing protein [Epibacterium sp.]NQX72657.1 DUF2852 domain-containing protein [Epibacterium sp.]
MTSFTTNAPPSPGWLARAEAWMDAQGKGTWIAAMVIGFIFYWPVGLALLAYVEWKKPMFSSCARKSRSPSSSSRRGMSPNSGNSAFDAYKADTLRRLEEEQSDFEAFLGRLREAKDKAEFDQFMDERAKTAVSTADEEKPAS